jgi:very-short-patch-repair endonuclease
MTRVFNKTDEKTKRKMLRKNMPRAEVILWSKLKDKGLKGYKFRRQYSVDKFVIDFYCPKLKLAIEIDGDSHFIEGADISDRERQAIIESFGITFLRFTNKEIYENVDGVLEKIFQNLPSPLLAKEGRLGGVVVERIFHNLSPL